MTVFVDNPQIRCKTRFTNTAKDHRIRLLVKTHNSVQAMILKVSMRWWHDQTNQQLHGKILKILNTNKPLSVCMTMKRCDCIQQGIEWIRNPLETTPLQWLFWCIRWVRWLGLFPTPEAQCLRDFEVEFVLNVTSPRTLQPIVAKALQTPFTSLQLARQEGSVAATGSLLSHSVSAYRKSVQQPLKWRKMKKDMYPFYNMSQENVRISEHQQIILDLLERPYSVHRGLISPQEIRTEFIKKRRNLISKVNIKERRGEKVRTNCWFAPFMVKRMTIATIDIEDWD